MPHAGPNSSPYAGFPSTTHTWYVPVLHRLEPRVTGVLGQERAGRGPAQPAVVPGDHRQAHRQVALEGLRDHALGDELAVPMDMASARMTMTGLRPQSVRSACANS
jgi:hypothetical protein